MTGRWLAEVSGGRQVRSRPVSHKCGFPQPGERKDAWNPIGKLRGVCLRTGEAPGYRAPIAEGEEMPIRLFA